MVKKINKSEEIDNKVKDKTITLDKPEHKKAIQEMNEVMRLVKRDFVYMSKKSELSARDVFFT